MKPFSTHDGLVAPMDRENIDTDAILPVQFMKSVERTGFGQYLFDGLRYLDAGAPGMDCSKRPLNPRFVLNKSRYAGASILLARANFGCGSSREHAPWALEQFGFRVLIAPSFADIFRENSFKNGLLPVSLDDATVDLLFMAVEANPGYRLHVDLASQTVVDPDGREFRFAIDPAHKAQLARGLDPVSATLAGAAQIKAFESRHRLARPWLFDPIFTGDKQ